MGQEDSEGEEGKKGKQNTYAVPMLYCINRDSPETTDGFVLLKDIGHDCINISHIFLFPRV